MELVCYLEGILASGTGAEDGTFDRCRSFLKDAMLVHPCRVCLGRELVGARSSEGAAASPRLPVSLFNRIRQSIKQVREVVTRISQGR